MLNIHITNKAKATAIDDRTTENQLVFRNRMVVPGFSEFSGSPVIFVQPEKYTYNANGLHCLIAVHQALNDEFINEDGELFLTVGKNFLKLSHKQQLCALIYVAFVAGIPSGHGIGEVENLGEYILSNEFCRSYDICTILNSSTIGETEFLSDSSAIELLLGIVFGARTANGVIRLLRDSVKHDLKVLQKNGYRTLKKAKATYASKDFRDAAKVSEKRIKNIMKATAKAAKHTEKAQRKAKAATNAAVDADLDAMADEIETLVKDVKDDVNPEAGMA